MDAETRNTRQRIVDQAAELFYARGYTDVGVQQICQAAAVKKGSFYHFFPSKQALALAVIDNFDDIFLHRILATTLQENIPPLERLSLLIEKKYAFHKEMMQNKGRMLGCPYGNMASEMSVLDPVVTQRLNKSFGQILSALESLIVQAQQLGDIPPQKDTHEAAESLFAYLEGVNLIAKSRNDPELFLQLGRKVGQLLK